MLRTTLTAKKNNSSSSTTSATATKYRTPLSDISMRSDYSMTDSGVGVLEDFDDGGDGDLNTENINMKLKKVSKNITNIECGKKQQRIPLAGLSGPTTTNIPLSTTRKMLASMCQLQRPFILPSPVLPPPPQTPREREPNKDYKRERTDDVDDDIDENKSSSHLLDTLPPSIKRKFEPRAEYSHIGGLQDVLSERKSVVYDFSEYSVDILAYWLSYEKRVRPKRWYMEKQTDITYKMRTILVDWLIEVAEEYGMFNETIFKTVTCLDRFLSKMCVTRSKLQLVGTAAMWVVSKFEELHPPTAEDFVGITDNCYTKEQLIQMEKVMLTTIGFDLLVPTAFDFVHTFSSILRLESHTTCLAMYLAELTILDAERYLQYLPSIIATAAIAVARYTFQNCFWDINIEKLSTHKLMDIQHCSHHLYTSFYDAPSSSHAAVFEKYKAIQFCSISLCILPAKLPWS